MPKWIRGLSEVFAAYDGFILDLWGVVHNGVEPLPGTIPALSALKKAGRKVWLLSNAPRRAATVAESLSCMGVVPELYTGLLTSGEATWQALKDELLQKWGNRCLHLGYASNHSAYEGLDIRIIKTPEMADFVLHTSLTEFSDRAEDYIPLLRQCAALRLPMICANPDKVVHVGEHLIICPGTLAEIYEGMGGEVVYFGKPHRGVYSRCLQSMNMQNVLAVGDSMLTDIAGATGAGLDSVLVTSGIHREELVGDAKMPDFLANYAYRPTYIMPAFEW